MTTEIIKPEEITEYINYLAMENYVGNGSWLARLQHDLQKGNASPSQVQEFIKWRKHVQLSNRNV